VIDSPSGRVPEKVSIWDLEGTETCGGGKSVLGGSLLVWEYLRIYSAGIRSGGATRGPQAWGARPTPQGVPGRLVVPPWLLRSSPEASSVSSGPEKINPKFFLRLVFVWYYFPKKPKTCRKQQLALGTGLIG
jgi:hypothetical protein